MSCELLFAKLKDVNVVLDRTMAHELRNTSVPYSQAGVLAFLAEREDQDTSNRQIEERFGISNPTVSGLLKRLAAKELITRSTDSSDRRIVNTRITEAGIAAVKEADQKLAKVENRIVEGLTDREQSELLRLLNIVQDNLS